MKYFRKVSASGIPVFQSKACAFSFGLSKLMQEGKDLLTASDGAVKFANQQAEMLRLPDNIAIQKTGFEGTLQNIGKIMEFVEVNSKKYPTAAELALSFAKGSGATLLGGLFGVKAAEQSSNDTMEVVEPIVYADENTDDEKVEELKPIDNV